jgi:hypothetical protein
MMMLGEPGLVEPYPLREFNLGKQLVEGLAFRHPGSRLVVTESSKAHALILRSRVAPNLHPGYLSSIHSNDH